MAARVIAERYELRERIGRGAMGEVWAALDLHTGTEVAVKLALEWTATEPELVARFEREGTLLGRMKSPFVCALLDMGRDSEGVPYVVLERLQGETVGDLLSREGSLPMSEVARITDEILQALVVIHRAGIVHRDLSPDNVFLHEARRGGKVQTLTKVLDFGVAKDVVRVPSYTGGRATMGALAYVAPEQLGDSATAGPRADLYALGTIVFRALTGRLPFGEVGGTALVVLKREHDPPTIDELTGEKWPARVRAFLQKTVARSPSKRYASAEVALTAWRAAQTKSTPPRAR